jgi:antitoxin VapB
MPLNIRSEAVNELAGRLASQWGVSKTEAVRLALAKALEPGNRSPDDFTRRIEQIQNAYAARPASGLKADKAFYDSLNDE